MIYLDYNANSPTHPDVIRAVAEAMQLPTNPSSIHSLGRKAKQQLEDARRGIADAVGAWPNEVIFTASGTEANNMALRAFTDRPMLVGATEHASILKLAERLGADLLPVDGNGLIDLDAFEAKLKSLGRAAFVSIMLANNETGVIQPMEKISQIAKKHGAIIHCDCVQALGKIAFDMGTLGVDMLTISGHKCGGPIGAGALVLRNDMAIKPLIIGGGQELNRRGGTENIPAIVGFGVAVEIARTREWVRDVENWMADMETDIMRAAPDAMIVGANTARLANTACIVMPGVSSETQLMTNDLEGICLSGGAACSSGRIEASHVLKAMGYGETVAASAIRVSAGWNTQESDIKAFTEVWKRTYGRLSRKAA